MNLEMFFATWAFCWALHRQWVQSKVVQWDRQRETHSYSRSTFDPFFPNSKFLIVIVEVHLALKLVHRHSTLKQT